MLVLLLRLRQVCSHPSLIQENALAYIRPGEEAVTSNRNAELLRAVEIAGSGFVERVRDKFREIALSRMAAEKAVCCPAHRYMLLPDQSSRQFSRRMPQLNPKIWSVPSAWTALRIQSSRSVNMPSVKSAFVSHAYSEADACVLICTL